MDLGIGGRIALVCASSRGLGKACALALAQEGCEVLINGRDAESLEHTAQDILRSTGRLPRTVVADLSTAAGRQALLAACPVMDILVTNNGGPEPGRPEDWDHAAWLAAIEANMLSGILLIQAVVVGMRARGFGRIVNITSAMVKSPRLPLGLSTAARAGLTAFCKALSVEVVRDNVTINNLLPERIETDRLRFMTEQLAELRQLSFEQARVEMLKPIAARRFGQPSELAAACAFLCSAQAGYITGQNLQIDGGSYAGLI
ncbi:SDR family oxidoreductase [Pseudomonas veronii]|jgi:3-oxoacyl-[acyl-carrier protein] reductase|uniref:NADPH-dependent reductase BacG n=3 Tax=Pseudomonas fluorescens group TaxID=136843 RepID=A0A5E6TT92_PSEFL|nr:MULTISPECIES: SDR family oxidoreductase [Pseudomonas]MDZ4325633.1 SDR family oxidoreductase [Pseudomonas sp.]SEC72750.1 3-oxoacyl-[acyl-carrier protein] reductase [Pseudomonas marginalis]KAA0975506.1 SDR family oxidoreductase [Pseudomonas sp. ANT_H12B]KRP76138.1 3-oxoacyl-ACP reductase [Pseudomonas veronii]MBF4554635.1 SDR family oxidoreductase [Pseudomonas sp. p50(2008)]